jgi:tetratricopeptide (TPR) repeat protein
LDVAKEYAQRIVQVMPGEAVGHMLLGTVLLRSNNYPAAGEQFDLARRLVPADPEPHLKLASVYAGQKKFAESENELESALQIAPRSHQALGQFADYLVSRGQRPKAVLRMKDYVKTYPDDATGYVILGSLELGGKQYPEAKAELERAIQLDPNLIQAYLELGKIHQDLGERDVAIARYEKALSLQPNFAPLQTLLGNLYLDKGDLAQARKYFEQALAVNPNFAVASANLAWVYVREKGNLDVALGLAQRAKQLLPDLDSITDTLAWVQYLKGDYTVAFPLLKECVEKSPQFSIYRYHLGMAALATGDKGQARSQLEKALKLKLAGEDARQARQTLAQLN